MERQRPAENKEVRREILAEKKRVSVYVPKRVGRKVIKLSVGKRQLFRSARKHFVFKPTMQTFLADEFGGRMDFHHRYPVTFKSGDRLIFVHRYFFGLKEGDFGRKITFDVKVVRVTPPAGKSSVRLELRRLGHPDGGFRPAFKLKITRDCGNGILIDQFPTGRVVFVPCGEKGKDSAPAAKPVSSPDSRSLPATRENLRKRYRVFGR
ncbi:MAG TPA: hypothetical protein VMD74_00735 [Candidatus Methylomirabilis sp.]|nr:hypothetical protein [Candidatus Methylomirabilis sp.]